MNEAVDETEYTEETPAALDPMLIRAREITSSMEDSLLASQVLISGVDGSGSVPQYMSEIIKKYPPGGIMFFKYNLNADNEKIRGFLSEYVKLIYSETGVRPFLAVDHEGGTVNRFLPGVADLPNASYYWDIFQKEGREEALSSIENDSREAAAKINSLGVNMNFAPVAEHINDNNRGFLLYRSYGPDPVFAYQASLAFIQGMSQSGILSVIKHFPGSAGPDPHISASVINMDRDELDSLIFPFLALINNGARAMMIAHTLVPSIDNKIASLSKVFMRDLLRNELGFDGIIISDDFIMQAAGNMSRYQAAVYSIAAGADMILVWPGDLERTHRAIMSALEEGLLSRETLFEAVQRINYEKLKLGLLN